MSLFCKIIEFGDVILGKESALPNKNDMRLSKTKKCTYLNDQFRRNGI